MLDHDFEPLLKVLLHAHSAALQQILDSLNLRLQLLKLCILRLVLVLEVVDFALELIFFFRAHQFSVVVDHASQGILLAYLLDLVR